MRCPRCGQKIESLTCAKCGYDIKKDVFSSANILFEKDVSIFNERIIDEEIRLKVIQDVESRLQVAKSKAIRKLSSYKNISEYRQREQEIFVSTIRDAKERIKKASAEDEVARILTEVDTVIGGLKTDAELTEYEERNQKDIAKHRLEAEKKSALTQLSKYETEANSYGNSEQIELLIRINQGKEQIGAAETVGAVTKSLNEIEGRINEIKTTNKSSLQKNISSKSNVDEQVKNQKKKEAKVDFRHHPIRGTVHILGKETIKGYIFDCICVVFVIIGALQAPFPGVMSIPYFNWIAMPAMIAMFIHYFHGGYRESIFSALIKNEKLELLEMLGSVLAPLFYFGLFLFCTLFSNYGRYHFGDVLNMSVLPWPILEGLFLLVILLYVTTLTNPSKRDFAYEYDRSGWRNERTAHRLFFSGMAMLSAIILVILSFIFPYYEPNIDKVAYNIAVGSQVEGTDVWTSLEDRQKITYGNSKKYIYPIILKPGVTISGLEVEIDMDVFEGKNGSPLEGGESISLYYKGAKQWNLLATTSTVIDGESCFAIFDFDKVKVEQLFVVLNDTSNVIATYGIKSLTISEE